VRSRRGEPAQCDARESKRSAAASRLRAPGFVTVEQDDTLQTTALQVENDKIVAIYVTRNPDKLRHIADHHLHRIPCERRAVVKQTVIR